MKDAGPRAGAFPESVQSRLSQRPVDPSNVERNARRFLFDNCTRGFFGQRPRMRGNAGAELATVVG